MESDTIIEVRGTLLKYKEGRCKGFHANVTMRAIFEEVQAGRFGASVVIRKDNGTGEILHQEVITHEKEKYKAIKSDRIAYIDSVKKNDHESLIKWAVAMSEDDTREVTARIENLAGHEQWLKALDEEDARVKRCKDAKAEEERARQQIRDLWSSVGC